LIPHAPQGPMVRAEPGWSACGDKSSGETSRIDLAPNTQTPSGTPGLDLHVNSNVHFQFAFCERAHEFAEVFRRHGIGVRVLGAAHGVTPDALRIVAPRVDERDRFAAALADVPDSCSSAGRCLRS
jgi:hypothetical protein